MSITQASNITALAGVIVWIASLFKITLLPIEIEQAIGAVIVLIGICTSFYNRYKKGDLTIVGARK